MMMLRKLLLPLLLVLAFVGCKNERKPNIIDSYAQAVELFKAEQYAQAYPLLKELAESGHPAAQNDLGVMYDRGLHVPVDKEVSFYWCEKAAEGGNGAAMDNIGKAYLTGDGVEVNCKMAVFWFEKGVQKSIVESAFNLSNMYYEGETGCLDQDIERSSELMAMASKSTSLLSKFAKGLIFYRGLGVEKDYVSAYNIFKELAEDGYVKGETYLGIMYGLGYGVPKNLKRAFYWNMRAAKQGSTTAQYALAVDYFYGESVDKNYDLAFKYATLASSKNSDAMYLVGYMYENAISVERNVAEAKRCYTMSAKFGNKYAADRLAKIGKGAE